MYTLLLWQEISQLISRLFGKTVNEKRYVYTGVAVIREEHNNWCRDKKIHQNTHAYWASNILLTVNAVVSDSNKASVLMLVTQFIVRWIVENVLTESAAASSVTVHDFCMISWPRTCRLIQRTLITETDFSWLHADDLTRETCAVYREALIRIRTTSMKNVSHGALRCT